MWGGVVQVGQAGVQHPVVDAREQHGVVQAGVGDLVAVGVWDALDQCVFA
jgi:hypothetical protein